MTEERKRERLAVADIRLRDHLARRREVTAHVPSNPMLYRLGSSVTRCGAHGDDTSNGRCTSCDRESGTIRPAALVGLLFALVPFTLLVTFSARLAGMLAGTVGAA